ncbi:hypothetical protein K32_48810 [Kaistia sp. 32K]|uniref:hypothetical protein n=1 Tax=Kaistia sp. 32K TaxID=2795690 RepID=UPI001916A259|nr:hypothetical protein [Kaistia sp. 32K]BCP56264.1 hypothetical protein K32_48810 [Kaistia sp. 32K]
MLKSWWGKVTGLEAANKRIADLEGLYELQKSITARKEEIIDDLEKELNESKIACIKLRGTVHKISAERADLRTRLANANGRKRRMTQ